MDSLQFFACLLILAMALLCQRGLRVMGEGATNPKGPPAGCLLNATSPFSWVVAVWDHNRYASPRYNGEPGIASMGSLITVNAALTTAYYYVSIVLRHYQVFERLHKWERFEVIAQYIWDRKNPQGRMDPCYQTRKVHSLDFHQRSYLKEKVIHLSVLLLNKNGLSDLHIVNEHRAVTHKTQQKLTLANSDVNSNISQRILYDFAIVVMKRPFDILATSPFPTMSFPTEPLDLLLTIRYVNVIQSDSFCVMPTPEKFNDRKWNFAERVRVRSKLFHTQCIKELCTQKDGGEYPKPQCISYFNAQLNATMLCMVLVGGGRLKVVSNHDGSLYPNAYAGSPLLCNGTVLGMSNFIKNTTRQDIFFTITLLRVFPWINFQIRNHTLRLKQKLLGQFSSEKIPEPPRLPTEDWGLKHFITLGPKLQFPKGIYRRKKEGQSEAVVCRPIVPMTLSASLLLLLAPSLM